MVFSLVLLKSPPSVNICGLGGRKSQKNGLVTGALFFSSPLVSRFAKNASFAWLPPSLKRNWGERPLCPAAVNCVLFFVFPLTVLKGVLVQHLRSYSQPSHSSAITRMRTHASAIGDVNISDLTSHAYSQKAAKQVNMKCFGKMSANA